MEFKNLKAEDYPAFLKLYNSAFPADERRLYKDTEHLASFIHMKGGKFHVFTVEDGGEFLGFLSYWVFEGYVYVEHFAVEPEHRGRNIGRKMLHHLFEEVSPDVLIEVELPETDEARRRIRFYEQNGFRVRSDFEYVQPPYGEGQKPLKMLLITHGNVDLHNERSIADMLAEVYNVNRGV